MVGRLLYDLGDLGVEGGVISPIAPGIGVADRDVLSFLREGEPTVVAYRGGGRYVMPMAA